MNRSFLISLLLLSVVHTGLAITAITLGGTFDANGNSITNLEGLGITSSGIAKIGQTNNVYVAIRTDGLTGSGAELDPFDGSTQTKFDALMASFPANTHIHLGPGTFQTIVSPTNLWHPRSGWVISGEGMYVTTIQAAPTNLAGINYDLEVIKGIYNVAINDVIIRDLTVDCNWYAFAASADAGAGSFTSTDGHITNGSPILASPLTRFTPADVSRAITGTGIPSNTTISRLSLTMIAAASSGTALPQTTINVDSTSDFASAGTFRIELANEKLVTISYTGKTSTGFTGCSGGSGTLTMNDRVVAPTQVVMSANATATNSSASITFGGEKNSKLSGIWLSGSHNLLQLVRCINSYGSFANGQENFTLALVAPQGMAANYDDIRDCVVEQTVGNYGNPYAIFGDSAANPLLDSHVTNCYAKGNNTGDPNMGFNSGGVNGAYLKDCEIRDNSFVDCYAIFYCDTGTLDGVKVVNNTVIRGGNCIDFVAEGGGAWTKNNIFVLGNKIVAQNRNGPNASVGIWVGGALTTNLSITENEITFDQTGDGPGTTFQPFRLTTIQNGTVANNRVSDDAGAGPQIYPDAYGVNFSNNKTFSGRSLFWAQIGIGGISTFSGAASDDWIRFIPTTTGWYRILQTGLYPNFWDDMAGKIVISATANNNRGEVEFAYDQGGYGQIGTLTQYRVLNYDTHTIDQARISTSGDICYLDIHIASTQANSPVDVYSYGPRRGALIATPVVGATAADGPVALTFSDGIATTGIFSGKGALPSAGTSAQVLAKNSGSNYDAAWTSISPILDSLGSVAQGDILYRGTSSWQRLAAGTSGQFLKTQGASANPTWANAVHAGSAELVAHGLPTIGSWVTVDAAWVTTNTIITLTATSPPGVSGTTIYVSDITEGESFTITSDYDSDDRTINWIAAEATE